MCDDYALNAYTTRGIAGLQSYRGGEDYNVCFSFWRD